MQTTFFPSSTPTLTLMLILSMTKRTLGPACILPFLQMCIKGYSSVEENPVFVGVIQHTTPCGEGAGCWYCLM